MSRPVLQDDAFLADVQDARGKPDHLHLWWLGQSGFLALWRGRHLLLDPCLSEPSQRKQSRTGQPPGPTMERVIAPERLNFIDVVTSSYSRSGHMDVETLAPLFRVNPRLEMVMPEANREVAVDRLQLMAEVPRGMDAGDSLTVAGFRFHALPATHDKTERDSWGRHKNLGYVIQAGPWTIYHSGDTKLYSGMEELLRRWNIDVALLPINGSGMEKGEAGNLSGAEAANLAKSIRAGVAIPCRHELAEADALSPNAFEQVCGNLGQPCRVLRCGERWTSSEWRY